MINPAELQALKLKQTDKTTVKDRSGPNLKLDADEETEEKKEERRNYFFSTGLDRWYASLEDKTFRSDFVVITPEEAKVIVSFWAKDFKHKPSDTKFPGESEVCLPDSLQNLSERISNSIAALSPTTGAFVKLSTRSPKDSHLAFAKARKAYLEKAKSIPPDTSINDKLIQLAEIVIGSLCVRNGDEAIKLFISSDRAGEDLEYALESGEDSFKQTTCIVVREWVDIPQWAEFRGFVWNGKLNAIGQYNHLVVFPQLKEQVSYIKADLEKFFVDLKPYIPLDRYIIDFAWTKNKVYLVEVNPFDGEVVFPGSTGLWDWFGEDKEQMMNGPLELRIREIESPLPKLRNSIDPQWRNIVWEGSA